MPCPIPQSLPVAVVEQMARHMRARGLPQTLGTASALLTAQALQHGHGTAKWLLQPLGTGGGRQSSGSGGSGSKIGLPDSLVDSCLLGRGEPKACMQRLTSGDSGPSAPSHRRPSTAEFNVVLAGLAVRGCTEEAVQLFDHMKQLQQRAEQQVAAAAAAAGAAAPAVRAAAGGRRHVPAVSAAAAGRLHVAGLPGAPDKWTYSLLLYAALNARKDQQLELTLRAVQEAR